MVRSSPADRTGRALKYSAGTTLILAFTFAIAGFWMCFGDQAIDSDLRLARKSFDVGTVPLEESQTIIVDVINAAATPVQLVGVTQGCRKEGCVVVGDLPPEISPASSVEIVIAYTARRPGPFEVPVSIFTDNRRVPCLRIQIQGIAMSPSAETGG